ncbi:heat-inducible transcriptional repressor HrcA [Candidatus Neomarinimicrobiota bacterium]
MVEKLTLRQSKVLEATVENYILTAAPVASHSVTAAFSKPWSSATIRNTMATLEKIGYLLHPHTSSGKIPTDKGYRTYVDELMVAREIGELQQEYIHRRLQQISGDIEKHVQLVVHIISEITGCIGIAIAPSSDSLYLESIGLIPASAGRVLFVLELGGGQLESVIAEADDEIQIERLSMIEGILRERLCGLSLNEILVSIDARLKDSMADSLAIRSLLFHKTDDMISRYSQGELFVHGMSRIIKTPEFSDQQNIEVLANLLDDSNRLRELIVTDADDGVSVIIGDEHESTDLFSFTTFCRSFECTAGKGSLGILGPKRVAYAELTPILEYLTEELSDTIEYGES